QFLLRSGIYASASPCAPVVGMLSDQPGHPLRIFASHAAAPDALPESQVLRLRSSDCEAPAHFYYIGRRANDAENPAGLFRRRQRSDGSYQAAEELVEGVSAMTTSVGVTVCPEEPLTEAGTAPGCVLAYVDIDQLADWSDVFVVEITLSVQPLTDGVAQAGAATDFPADGVTVQFSTALRHAEPHSSGGDS
ncbi:MAG: PilW family protein, partial [Pseudohongiella sp.]